MVSSHTADCPCCWLRKPTGNCERTLPGNHFTTVGTGAGRVQPVESTDAANFLAKCRKPARVDLSYCANSLSSNCQ
jgi:hypothetical protein